MTHDNKQHDKLQDSKHHDPKHDNKQPHDNKQHDNKQHDNKQRNMPHDNKQHDKLQDPKHNMSPTVNPIAVTAVDPIVVTGVAEIVSSKDYAERIFSKKKEITKLKKIFKNLHNTANIDEYKKNINNEELALDAIYAEAYSHYSIEIIANDIYKIEKTRPIIIFCIVILCIIILSFIIFIIYKIFSKNVDEETIPPEYIETNTIGCKKINTKDCVYGVTNQYKAKCKLAPCITHGYGNTTYGKCVPLTQKCPSSINNCFHGTTVEGNTCNINCNNPAANPEWPYALGHTPSAYATSGGWKNSPDGKCETTCNKQNYRFVNGKCENTQCDVLIHDYSLGHSIYVDLGNTDGGDCNYANCPSGITSNGKNCLPICISLNTANHNGGAKKVNHTTYGSCGTTTACPHDVHTTKNGGFTCKKTITTCPNYDRYALEQISKVESVCNLDHLNAEHYCHQTCVGGQCKYGTYQKVRIDNNAQQSGCNMKCNYDISVNTELGQCKKIITYCKNSKKQGMPNTYHGAYYISDKRHGCVTKYCYYPFKINENKGSIMCKPYMSINNITNLFNHSKCVIQNNNLPTACIDNNYIAKSCTRTPIWENSTKPVSEWKTCEAYCPNYNISGYNHAENKCTNICGYRIGPTGNLIRDVTANNGTHCCADYKCKTATKFKAVTAFGALASDGELAAVPSLNCGNVDTDICQKTLGACAKCETICPYTYGLKPLVTKNFKKCVKHPCPKEPLTIGNKGYYAQTCYTENGSAKNNFKSGVNFKLTGSNENCGKTTNGKDLVCQQWTAMGNCAATKAGHGTNPVGYSIPGRKEVLNKMCRFVDWKNFPVNKTGGGDCNPNAWGDCKGVCQAPVNYVGARFTDKSCPRGAFAYGFTRDPWAIFPTKDAGGGKGKGGFNCDNCDNAWQTRLYDYYYGAANYNNITPSPHWFVGQNIPASKKAVQFATNPKYRNL